MDRIEKIETDRIANKLDSLEKIEKNQMIKLEEIDCNLKNSYDNLHVESLLNGLKDVHSKYNSNDVAKAINILKCAISIQYLSSETKKYVYRDLQKLNKVKEILDLNSFR